MTLIIVCCHADLAEGLVSAAQMIVGETDGVYAIGFFEGDSLVLLMKRIAEAIEISGADQALMLTDLFGASPANAASAVMCAESTETLVITGANLAILTEAMLSRDSGEPLPELAARLCSQGREQMRLIDKGTAMHPGRE